MTLAAPKGQRRPWPECVINEFCHYNMSRTSAQMPTRSSSLCFHCPTLEESVGCFMTLLIQMRGRCNFVALTQLKDNLENENKTKNKNWDGCNVPVCRIWWYGWRGCCWDAWPCWGTLGLRQASERASRERVWRSVEPWQFSFQRPISYFSSNIRGTSPRF